MQIELKNVKHHKSLSEETNAFTATVHIDGKRAAEASNRGHGEPVLIVPLDGGQPALDAAAKYFESLDETPIGEGMTLQPDLEYAVSLLVTADLARKEVHRLVKRKCKAGSPETLIYRPDTGQVLSLKVQADKRMKDSTSGKTDTGANLALAQVRKECADPVCLNDLFKTDPEQAYQLYAKGIELDREYNLTVEKELGGHSA